MEYSSTAPDSHVPFFPEEESAHIDISDSFMTADTYSCSALGLYPGDIPLLGWTHGTIGSMDFNPDNLITGTGDIGIPRYGQEDLQNSCLNINNSASTTDTLDSYYKAYPASANPSAISPPWSTVDTSILSPSSSSNPPSFPSSSPYFTVLSPITGPQSPTAVTPAQSADHKEMEGGYLDFIAMGGLYPASLSALSPGFVEQSGPQERKRQRKKPYEGNGESTDSRDSVDVAELMQTLVTTGRSDRIGDLESLLKNIEAVSMAEGEAEVISSKKFTPFFETTRVRQTANNPVPRHYRCVFCNYQIGNRTQIIQHLMRRHFFYRPHKCDACPSAFSRLADLKKHQHDRHSGEKFPCSCGKTYTNDRNRRRHQGRSKSCFSPA